MAYTVSSQWSTGFSVAVSITNLGSPVTSWTLGYSYGGNQALTQGGSGNWSQSGKAVTVTNVSWNGSLGTGASIQLGANFSYSGTNTNPATFTLNGVTCNGQVTGPAGSVVTSGSALSITQGSTGTVGISLSAVPAGNVMVSPAFRSGDTGLSVTAGGSLTFTPADYSTLQYVVITANSSGTGAATFTASASGWTAATITATETSVATSAAPQLHVSGNKLLNSNGMDVILDLHWTDGAYTEPSAGCSSAQVICQKPMPDAAQAIPFWSSVASVFKGSNFNACNTQSCWTSQIAPVIAPVPVIAGESGENDCAGTYINPLTTWLDSQHTSYLAWAWNADFNCSSGSGLVTDYVPGDPSAYVAAYKAHLAFLGL